MYCIAWSTGKQQVWTARGFLALDHWFLSLGQLSLSLFNNVRKSQWDTFLGLWPLMFSRRAEVHVRLQDWLQPCWMKNWCPRLCSSLFFSTGKISSKKEHELLSLCAPTSEGKKKVQESTPRAAGDAHFCPWFLLIIARALREAVFLEGFRLLSISSLYYQSNKTPCLGLSNCYQCDCF